MPMLSHIPDSDPVLAGLIHSFVGYLCKTFQRMRGKYSQTFGFIYQLCSKTKQNCYILVTTQLFKLNKNRYYSIFIFQVNHTLYDSYSDSTLCQHFD